MVIASACASSSTHSDPTSMSSRAGPTTRFWQLGFRLADLNVFRYDCHRQYSPHLSYWRTDMPHLVRAARLFGLATAIAAGAIACASGGAASSPQAGGSTSRMDSTEFRRTEFRTIYDAIHAMHPDWLQARGGPTSTTNRAMRTPVIGIFIEGEMRGYGIDKLTELVGRDVRSIRRINSSESLGTYGSDWPWGGIVITRAR